MTRLPSWAAGPRPGEPPGPQERPGRTGPSGPGWSVDRPHVGVATVAASPEKEGARAGEPPLRFHRTGSCTVAGRQIGPADSDMPLMMPHHGVDLADSELFGSGGAI